MCVETGYGMLNESHSNTLDSNPWNCKCHLIWWHLCRFGEVKCLRWGDYPGLGRYVLNIDTCILIRGKQREIWYTHTEKRKQCEEGPKRVRIAGLENWNDVAMRQGMSAATRSLKRWRTCSLKHPEEAWPCWHLYRFCHSFDLFPPVAWQLTVESKVPIVS